MKWLENRWRELCGHYRIGFFAFIVSFLIAVMATAGTWLVTKNLYDQQAVQRWAGAESEYAQISCFYPVSDALDEFDFLKIHHFVDEVLTAASLTSENPNADLFVDAYSVMGRIHVSTEKADKELQVVGVSDSFFLFHPVTLLSGSYFDENMIMKDGVILDEETAFLLYGSNDVVGMPVYIGNVPYYIRGVMQKEDSYYAKKAGLSEAVCYVSVETLREHGTIEGSYVYEAVIPNPVDSFAKNTVIAALNDASKIEVVENSARFSFDAKKEIVLDFGGRSMSRNAIVYPYWENIARAAEDTCGLIFIIQMGSFLVAMVLLIVYVRILYRQRTWSIRELVVVVKDIIYERKCKRR